MTLLERELHLAGRLQVLAWLEYKASSERNRELNRRILLDRNARYVAAQVACMVAEGGDA